MKNKNKNKNNNNNNALILSIIAVTLIAVLVSGGTYAYWTWVSNDANSQRTNVNFVISGGDKYANLEGAGTADGSTSITNLKPIPCTDTTFAVVKTVPIKWANYSTNDATVTATLKVTSFKFRDANYKPTTGSSGTLKSLKWAIRESAATTATTSSPNTCETSATASGDFAGLTIPNTGTTVTSGLPLTLGSVSFTATANTSTQQTKTYYLYIWLDYNYSHQNVGSVNSDPMQDLEFVVQWSGTIT